MTHRPLIPIFGALLLALTLNAPCQARGMAGQGMGQGHGRGYSPWLSSGFYSGFPFYSPYDYDNSSPTYSSPPPPAPTQATAPNPATAQVAYANAEYDNALADYVATVQHARDEFHNSTDYQSAQREVADASQFYDAASESALVQVRRDPAYRTLVEQRTEIEIALKSAPLHSGLRYVLAAEKLNCSAQLSAISASALASDPTFQQARSRLTAAHQSLSDLRQRFEAGLATRPDVASARRALQTARSNRAAARGFLATPYDRGYGNW